MYAVFGVHICVVTIIRGVRITIICDGGECRYVVVGEMLFTRLKI